jgi:hypothetical protein
MDFTTKRSEAINGLDFGTQSNGPSRALSEMKLDDEDEFNLLDNNNNPNNLSAIESPEKINLLDGS